MHANIIALTVPATHFKQVEDTLCLNMITIQTFLKQWRLKLSLKKTVRSAFHQFIGPSG